MKKLKKYLLYTLVIICFPIGFVHEIITGLTKVLIDITERILFILPMDVVGVFYYGIPKKWEQYKKLWERVKKETE